MKESMNKGGAAILSENRFSFSHIGKYAAYIAAVFMLVFFGALTRGKMFTPMNITNLFIQNAYLFLLTVGLFFCILVGHTDLSVGSIVGFCGVILGMSYVWKELPTAVSILLALAAGLLIGCLHGLLITKFKLTPFVVTLAGSFAYRGLCMLFLQGSTLGPLSKGVQTFAKGYLLPSLMIGEISVVCLAAFVLCSAFIIYRELNSRKKKLQYGDAVISTGALVAKLAVIILIVGSILYNFNAHKGLPIIVIVVVAIVAMYSFIAQNTVLGRQAYALGGNSKATSLSGVNVNKIMFLVYVNSAVLAALAGVVVSGYVNATSTNAGDGYQMDAIAACYIGGCSGSGGTGSLLAAMVGACVMALLNNGMTLMGWGSDVQQVIKGVMLLAAVAFDVYSRSKSRG